VVDSHINKVKEIDVAAVEGNMALAAGMGRRAIERRKAAIEKLGVLHTPVVGAAKGGGRVLLSGQCELAALRELGVKKMDAVEVEVAGGAGDKAKLSLLLISLMDGPGALCEGKLLQEAVSAGVPRMEIQAMLGKSASWVSNRLSLVARLDGHVYAMVRDGLLDPRSAQEVARLPSEAQFAFAEAAVRGGLPKSAIESLVAGYNDAGCPDAVKGQIIADPVAALPRVGDRRRAVKAGRAAGNGAGAPTGAGLRLETAKAQLAALGRTLSSIAPGEAAGPMAGHLMDLEAGLLALLAAVRALLSPGKTEVGQDAG
jgi:ParB-like chromosome segregation protein Spo0J